MKEQIKQVALNMAKKNGLINLSRADLCKRAGVPEGSFPIIMGCTFTDFVSKLNAEGVDGTKYHVVTKRRANPELRKEQLIIVAIEIAKKNGYTNLTRTEIAERAGLSMGLINNYLGNLTQLRRAVMRYAVHNNVVEIVAQGLANKDKHARKATPELKEKAAQLIASR